MSHTPSETKIDDLSFALAPSGDMSGDVVSDSYHIDGMNNYCLQYEITDSSGLSGTLDLKGSNNEATEEYFLIASHTIASDTTGGAFNVDKPMYRYVRIEYTAGSGSATLVANINRGVS